MKNRFTLILMLLVSLSLIISSCGSEAGIEEVKKEFDCECNKLFNQGGRELYSMRGLLTKKERNQARADNNQAFIDSKGDTVFTGTCAVLSDDRSKDILALHSFDKGYRTKKSTYEMIKGEKIQTAEFTFNEKDKRTGWYIDIQKQISGDDLYYVSEYVEEVDDVEQYSYEIDYDQFEHVTFLWIKKNGELESNKTCTFSGLPYSTDKSKTAELKSFFECISKMKLKKWWYKFEAK
jgi:hypothetical protein